MEMVGGCCVCSDDRGWTENPLVYCDGQGCNVAVHQACYGIVTVPPGPWFCRKCESQERAAKVRCELCPSKDGALKRTDNGGWAHVVCALYIPEVRFGNVTTMEPILLSMVPTERFSKGCYVCESRGLDTQSKIGACMNCNKSGCKHHFHVTCAQTLGLLCEEAGNYMDNVKYCGYCQHHYSKLKKGTNLKQVPAFKPLPSSGLPTDASSDKSSMSHVSGSSWSGQSQSGPSNCNGSKDKQRKKPGRKSTSQVSPKAGSGSSSVIVEGPHGNEDSKLKSPKSDISYPSVLAGVGLVPGPRPALNDQNSSSADRNESSASKPEVARNSEKAKSSGAKKAEKAKDNSKPSGSFSSVSASSSAEPTNVTISTDKSRTSRRKGSMRSTSPTSQGGNDTESTNSSVSEPGLSSAPDSFTVNEFIGKGQPMMKCEQSVTSTENSSSLIHTSHSVIVSSATVAQTESSSTLVQSSQPVPQKSVSPHVISAAASGSSQTQSSDQAKISHKNVLQSSIKESIGNSSATPAKKPRRGRAPKVSAPIAPDSPPSSPESGGTGEHNPKRRKKPTKSAMATLQSDNQHHLAAAVSRAEGFLSAHLQQKQATIENTSKPTRVETKESGNKDIESAPESSVPHVSSPSTVNSVGTKDLNLHKDGSSSFVSKENNPYLRNGINAPHMLGNQLNPNSSVAQKMTDTLAAELEAHSITNQLSPVNTTANYTGVPFPVRAISPSLKPNASSSSTSISTTASFPQNLEQLLERQWEQGSKFLMEQAQQFDIASLLSCLHNLRQENMRLEDHVANLNRRRDHLLAVNARLSVPLGVTSHMAFSSIGANSSDRSTPGSGLPSGHLLRGSPQDRERNSRGTPFLPPMENGMTEHLSAFMGAPFSSPHGSHRSSAGSSHQSDRVIPSPVIVSSRINPVYHPVPTMASVSVPSTMSPIQGSSSFMSDGRNLTVLRSPPSTPEMRPDATRSAATSSQQPPSYPYQMVSSPLPGSAHHPASYTTTSMPNSNQHVNARREDSRHHLGRPSSIERR